MLELYAETVSPELAIGSCIKEIMGCFMQTWLENLCITLNKFIIEKIGYA